MKMGKNIKLFLILIILLALQINGVSAQKVTSSAFDKSLYYQGDTGSLKVTIINDYSLFQITTKQCYLQFDWLEAQNLVHDSGATPIIASGSTYTFTFIFNIPSDIAVGPHKYKVVWVDQGFLLGTVVVQSGVLVIHDAYEKVYYDIKPTVENKIVQANLADFQSADAKSLLQQAINEKNLAVQLAGQGKWSDAVTHLQTSSNLVDQSTAAENKYWKDKASTAISDAQSKINQVGTMESSDAKTFLSQANTKLTDAQKAYNGGDYKNAVQLATSASSLADQATAAEKSYQSQKQQQMILIGGIGGVAVVVVTTVLFFKGRRKRKPESTTVATP